MIATLQQVQQLMNDSEQKNTVRRTSDASFTEALETAQNLIDANLAAEAETEALTMDFLTGANDNIHSLLIAQQKSSILLQYTLQLRNGVLNAYKEIMQLSV